MGGMNSGTANMKVAIVGSRDYSRRVDVEAFVAGLPIDTEVVSGGARGVDTWAQLAAVKRGLHVTIFKAEWELHGRAAGYIRNEYIINYADLIVAFWDGQSRGTAHSIALADKVGKPYEIYLTWEDSMRAGGPLSHTHDKIMEGL